MTDLSGQYLGRYYLSERLGEGGMAVVYKAHDTRLERDVAIKIIRSSAFPVDALSEVLKRFEREAKALAKLSHPNIVKVYDFGEHEGSPFLVMEYLPGGTLKKFLGQLVPWQEAVRLILPVARGVAYAHQRGILHRDIKPANILITDGGEPMLSDFGIAKLFEAEQTTALTGSGMAIGTPEYMAPEQWTGVTSPQSDLYSLGIVLYEMVAGRKPYAADTPAGILIKQATEPLPSPRKFAVDLPEDLELILIETLAKEPEDRYKDMAAWIGALEKLHVSAPVVTPPALETKLAEKHPAIPMVETAASVSRRTPTALGGETSPVVEPETVQGSLSAPAPAKRTRPAIKFSRKGFGWLIGGVALVLAAWLGSPLMGKWFSPAPAPTETVTATMEVGTQPILPSQTLDPSPTSTEILLPTATSLPAQITDDKGVEMMLVPAGEFTMGSDSGQVDEKPAHQVYLDQYYIDRYEITNALYSVCVKEGACQQPIFSSSLSFPNYYGNSRYDNYPVLFVNWIRADNYCEWRGARLPTEAEWEKAARSADARIYPWGNQFDCKNANINDDAHVNNLVGSPTCDGYVDAAPVGTFPGGASPYGIFDMAGNVWEWVSDWYQEDYYTVLGTNATNPQGPATGTDRVIRGGSYYSDSSGVYTYARRFSEPDPDLHYATQTYMIGFRCALPAETVAAQPAVTQTPTPSPAASVSSTPITDAKGGDMVLVPAGKFIMGSGATEFLNFSEEKPQSTLYLDSFWIDKTEVTNRQYTACVEAGACIPPVKGDSNASLEYYGNKQFADHPVIYVNWDMAKNYCEWQGARLPTEAEWEKAARGTDGRVYPWGDSIDCELANFFGKDTQACIGDTTQVGRYPKGASVYGLFDMAGNVWEWVSSLYKPYPYQADDGREDPSVEGNRVLRGGSWYGTGSYVRTTVRLSSNPTVADNIIGFRCASDVAP